MDIAPVILIAFFIIGRLTTWAIQTSGPTRKILGKNKLLEEMRECDFCTGFWVFLGFAFLFQVNLLEPLYVLIVSEVLTALLASFVTHIFRIGWKVTFGIMEG